VLNTTQLTITERLKSIKREAKSTLVAKPSSSNHGEKKDKQLIINKLSKALNACDIFDEEVIRLEISTYFENLQQEN
jgi:hypothetical protein